MKFQKKSFQIHLYGMKINENYLFGLSFVIFINLIFKTLLK